MMTVGDGVKAGTPFGVPHDQSAYYIDIRIPKEEAGIDHETLF